MQPLLVLPDPELGNEEQENRIEENNREYKDIPIIFGFVHGYDEAIPLHE